MIVYLDSSVLLAWVFGEPRRPDRSFWRNDLVASRLLAYEAWVRLDAYGHGPDVRDGLRASLLHITLLDMTIDVLGEPDQRWPGSVRTLDALHPSTARYVQSVSGDLCLATYDKRMADCAVAVGLPLFPLPT